MKINRFLSVLLIVLNFTLIFCKNIVLADEDILNIPEFPDISSQYVVVMDADSREVLYSSNRDAQCYPASTTKILTGLLTIENKSLDDSITFSQNAVKSLSYGDANATISVGETMTIEQALYCLLLRSANEAAYGLAEEVSGSVSAFATLMNKRAESIGAVNTHFTNASGLSDTFHYTTPYDMALIASECFNNSEFMKITGYSGIYIIPPTNKSDFTRYYKHRYDMIKGGEFEYEYSCGGKTGYTDEAGSCLVSFAQKDDIRLVCVIFNSEPDTRYYDTQKLFDYYLSNYHKISIDKYDDLLSGNSMDLINLTSQLNTSNISLGFKDNAYLLVPHSVNPDELTTIVTYSDSPAYIGEKDGFACISFFYNNTNLGNATIFIKTPEINTKLPGTDGVVQHGQNYEVTKGEYIFINIWHIIGIILLIIIVILIIIFAVISKKRRSNNYHSSKLRF